jgi:hypothetical protein
VLKSFLIFIVHHEGAIKNGQPRETVNIRYTRRRKTKQKQNIICVGHHYAQANTNSGLRLCQIFSNRNFSPKLEQMWEKIHLKWPKTPKSGFHEIFPGKRVRKQFMSGLWSIFRLECIIHRCLMINYTYLPIGTQFIDQNSNY